MKPAYQISADGQNITELLKKHSASLSISDSAGFENDSMEITVSKQDLELPKTGAELDVLIGYEGQELINIGLFIVDELEINQQSLIIRCRAANISNRSKNKKNSIKSYRTRSWDSNKLADIIVKIASEHNYEPVISPEYTSQTIPQIDQTNESDMHFLTRLAKDYGAVFKVTAGRIIFLKETQASQLKFAGEIKYDQVFPDWRVTIKDRMKYSAVQVSYHDFQTAEKQSVTIGEGTPVRKIARTFPDKNMAVAAAVGELTRLSRGNQTIRFSTVGNPRMFAELIVKLVLPDKNINSDWPMTRVTHRIDTSGFITNIEGEAVI